MKNKYLTFVWVIIFTITMSTNFIITNAEEKSFSVSAIQNDLLMSEMIKNQAYLGHINSIQKENEITLDIAPKKVMALGEYNDFSISGTILLDNKEKQFYTEGELYYALNSEGNEGMYGTTTGFFDNSESYEDYITLNIQYMPKTAELYAFVSIGVVNDNSLPQYVVFGKPVRDLYDLIIEAAKIKEATEIKGEEICESEDINISTDHSPFAVSDYNTSYVGAQGSFLNGNQVTSLALFAPNRMKANSSYKMYTKVTASVTNANSYMRNSQILYGTTSTWIDKIYIYQGSKSEVDFEVSNLSPAQTTSGTSISFGVPVWNTGLSLFNVSISLPKIWTSTARYTGSTVDNSAQWSFFKFPSQMEWQNGSCAATKGGVSGCSTITYYKNRTSDYTFNVIGRSETTFSWQDVYGAEVRSGSFTSTNSGVTHSIVVDAS